jgi:hypothetical protein
MTTVGFGRVKQAGDELQNGPEWDTGLLKEVLRTPGEKDTVLVRQALLLQLALKALDRAIAEYCGGAGGRTPSYAALAQYLDEPERKAQPLRPRVKRLTG